MALTSRWSRPLEAAGFTAVGMMLYWLSARAALAYGFFVLVWLLSETYNELRVLIRVTQFSNEVKLMAIGRKLGVAREEIQSVIQETKDGTPFANWQSLQDDICHAVK